MPTTAPHDSHPPRDDRRLLKVDEAADFLGVCRRQIQKMAASGELPSVHVTKTARRYWMPDLLTFIEQRRKAR